MCEDVYPRRVVLINEEGKVDLHPIVNEVREVVTRHSPRTRGIAPVFMLFPVSERVAPDSVTVEYFFKLFFAEFYSANVLVLIHVSSNILVERLVYPFDVVLSMGH